MFYISFYSTILNTPAAQETHVPSTSGSWAYIYVRDSRAGRETGPARQSNYVIKAWTADWPAAYKPVVVGEEYHTLTV